MRTFVTASLLTTFVLASTFLDTGPSEGQIVYGRRAAQPRMVYRSPIIRRPAPQRFMPSSRRQHSVQQTQRLRSLNGTGHRERSPPHVSASRPLKRNADDVKGANTQRLQAEQARRAAIRSVMQKRANDPKGANANTQVPAGRMEPKGGTSAFTQVPPGSTEPKGGPTGNTS